MRLVRAFGYLLTRGSIFEGCTPTAYAPPLQVLWCLRPSSGGRDSNSQPSASEADALTIELRPVLQDFGLLLLQPPSFRGVNLNQPMKQVLVFPSRQHTMGIFQTIITKTRSNRWRFASLAYLCDHLDLIVSSPAYSALHRIIICATNKGRGREDDQKNKRTTSSLQFRKLYFELFSIPKTH